MNNKYRIEKLLGKGGTGAVYLCTNVELGNRLAVKHIPVKGINDKTISEIEILKKLHHLSLPRIIDVFRNEQGLFIVESDIEGNTLDRLLRRYGSFDPERIVDWFIELCDILGYLHSIRPNPIIYKDMKPANVILSQSNRLVLIDFGISQEFRRCGAREEFIAGTGAYAAPEQLIRGGEADQRTDIYNLGVTMHQLLHGYLPGRGRNDSKHKKDKNTAKIDKIISGCIEKDPEDRYQRVEDIQHKLVMIKNAIVLQEMRHRVFEKCEVIIAAVLSAVSYLIIVMGIKAA